MLSFVTSQGFSYLLLFHKVEKLTVYDVSQQAIKVLSALYMKAAIPIQTLKDCIDKS